MAGQHQTASIVGDATRTIHEAWEFFFPAVGRLTTALVVVVLLGGGPILKGAYMRSIAVLTSAEVRALAATIDQYKLAPLIPIAALFVLSALVYIFNRIVGAVANLFPVNPVFSAEILLLFKGQARSLWYRMPEIESSTTLAQAVEFEISKARAQDRGVVVVRDIDYWVKKTSESYQQFAFTKFLAVWTVVWMVLLLAKPEVRHGLFVRGVLLLASIGVAACVSVLRFTYGIDQQYSAKAGAALLLLTMDGKLEIRPDDPRRAQIDAQIDEQIDAKSSVYKSYRPQWWWIDFGSWDWLRTVRNFKPFETFRFRGWRPKE